MILYIFEPVTCCDIQHKNLTKETIQSFSQLGISSLWDRFTFISILMWLWWTDWKC